MALNKGGRKAGYNHSYDTRTKISEAKIGIRNSDEHNAAISAALTGVPKSAESNEKRRAAAKAYWAAKRAAKEAAEN